METKNVILDYKDDLFFKYYCGKDGAETMDFRKFMIENITGLKIGDIKTSYTKPVTLTIHDKQIIMDTFISQDNYFLDMEMQNSTFNAYQSKRFQYYACKNIVLQLMEDEKNYEKLKEFHLILFINRKHKNKLINHATVRYEDGDEINDRQMADIHFVNLKNINRITRKRKLTEFEAVIYLMANNTLKGIEYEEKEGMVTYMERSNRDFNADLQMIKKLLEEREKEFFHAMELEESRKSALVDLLCQTIQMKYRKDARDWLMKCEEIQLMEINKLLYDNITYEELVQQFAVH